MTNNKSGALIKVIRLSDDAKLPTFGTDNSAGFDLYLSEDALIMPKRVKLLKTDLVIKPPAGYYLELCLRSSTPVKHEGIVLANGIGIIDPDYCGIDDEIKIPVLNTSDKSFLFMKGDRVAQLVLRELLKCDIVEDIYKAVPSRGGFGTTGD